MSNQHKKSKDITTQTNTSLTLKETLEDVTMTYDGETQLEKEVGTSLLYKVDPRLYVNSQYFDAGGMGEIRYARDQRLRRPVLIKELHANKRHNTSSRQRFEREIFISAALQHPGIVNVIEGGCWPDGAPFYAMEQVHGEDFNTVIERRPELDARLAKLQVVVDVANAMAYAHSQGVIHRDLKPANVLVGRFGEVVIIDWGLAKLVDETGDPSQNLGEGVSDDNLTQVGAVMGTLAYMPPEQAAGDIALDARADVYGIAAILYHLIAGHPPLQGTINHVHFAAGLIRPKPIQEVVDHVPPALVSIINKAMAQNADDRYPDAGVLAEDLQRYTTGQLVRSHTYSTRELVKRWIQHNRVLVTSASVALLVVLAVVAISFQQILAANAEKDQKNKALAVQRDKLTQKNQQLEEEKARTRVLNKAILVVHGQPRGAAIFIDGVRQKETLEGLGNLVKIKHDPTPSEKPYRLEIQAQNHHSQSRDILLKPQARLSLSGFVLEPLSKTKLDGMVEVLEGKFKQAPDFFGDIERAVHIRETFVDTFFIDTTEVTVAAYEACVKAKVCSRPRGVYADNPSYHFDASDRARHPINGVDWQQANEYCTWVGKRLPTEAEWEKAARGKDARRNTWGDEPPSCVYVVMDDGITGEGCGRGGAWPVGSKAKAISPFGVLDMSGNVAEWTADWYAPYDFSQTNNPTGPNTGQKRVVRGGSYASISYQTFATFRHALEPLDAAAEVGFRCALTPKKNRTASLPPSTYPKLASGTPDDPLVMNFESATIRAKLLRSTVFFMITPPSTVPAVDDTTSLDILRQQISHTTADDPHRVKLLRVQADQALARARQLEIQHIDLLDQIYSATETPDTDPTKVALLQSRADALKVKLNTHFNGSIDALRALVDHVPPAPEEDRNLFTLADLLRRHGQHKEAMAHLSRLTTDTPDSQYFPSAMIQLAEYHANLNDQTTALQLYRHPQMLKSKYAAEAQYGAAWCEFLMGKQKLALESLREALAIADEDLRQRLFKEVPLFLVSIQPDTADTVTFFDALGPEIAFKQIERMAFILEEFGKFSDAIDIYRVLMKSTKHTHHHLSFQYNIFNSSLAQGLEAQTLVEAKHLANMLADPSRSPLDQTARQTLVNKVRRSLWETTAFYHKLAKTMGSTHYMALARSFYDVILSLYDHSTTPSRTEIHYHLASLLLLQGQPEEALQWTTLVQDSETYPSELAKDVESLLDEIHRASQPGPKLPPKRASLDRASVIKTLHLQSPSFRSCYQTSLLMNPSLQGKLNLSFDIGPQGQTSEVSVESTLKTPVLHTCIQTTVRALKFPQGSTQSLRVNYPLYFESF